MLTIYKASAGSGKTFTLAYEYIKLLLGKKNDDGTYSLRLTGSEHHHSILAITFTNKATEEMKRRIIRELALLAGQPLPAEPLPDNATPPSPAPTSPQPDTPYRAMLLDLYHCTDSQLRSAARRALLGILHDFTFFNVSTIDSFFQLILRTFAREAELNGNFDIELDDTLAISIGVDQMLTSINRDDDDETRLIVHWIERYMTQQVNEGHSFNFLNRTGNLHDEIIRLIKNLNDETFKKHFDSISSYLDDPKRLQNFNKALTDRISDIRIQRTQAAKRVFDAAAAIPFSLSDWLNRYLLATLTQWAGGIDKEPSATVENALDTPEKRYKSAILKGKGPVIDPRLDSLITEAIAIGLQSHRDLGCLTAISRHIHILGILAPVLRYITRFRNENNLILLSDTNELLRRIISSDEAPFIYERLGMRLDHFLIDEFQDTSHLQWDNLSPLLLESLSRGNDNLIIGDEKQSIYRFRGGDPQLLRFHVANQFHRQTLLKGTDPASNTNWRSSAEIVRFNNSLFTRLAADLSLSDIYDNITQQVAPKHTNHHGYIKLKRIDDDFTDQALANLIDDIRQLRLAGHAPSDIVILTRGNDEASLVVSHLLSTLHTLPDIPPTPILSDEALHIDASPAVRLIISVLRYLDTPDNRPNHNIARIINRYEYFHSHGAAPDEAIRQALSSETPIDRLADEAAAIECTSVTSIVERIITRFLPQSTLSDQAPFIYAFQDLVLEFSGRFAPSVHTFLQWWDRSGHRRSIPAPATSDALRVMTIHKSKGLEFPCVIIPFANWRMYKSDETRWYTSSTLTSLGFPADSLPPILPVKGTKTLINSPLEDQYLADRKEQITDNLNATYVAFTRAVDVLIVYYPDSVQSAENNIAPFIRQALDNPDDPITEIGTIPHKAAPGSSHEAPAANHPYTTADNPHLWEKTRIDDLTEVTDIDDLFNLADPRIRGTILHSIMRAIRRPADLPRAIRRHISKGIITTELGHEFTRILSDALADPRVRPWFVDYTLLLAERAITITHRDNPPERYRPDRVVRTADGQIIVIDYKFGEHNDKYIRQVRRYMHLLSRQFPDSEIQGALWYPLTSTIIPVK